MLILPEPGGCCRDQAWVGQGSTVTLGFMAQHLCVQPFLVLSHQATRSRATQLPMPPGWEEGASTPTNFLAALAPEAWGGDSSNCLRWFTQLTRRGRAGAGCASLQFHLKAEEARPRQRPHLLKVELADLLCLKAGLLGDVSG